MNILAIDPGPEKSAYVLLEDGVPTQSGWWTNEDIDDRFIEGWGFDYDHLVIEKVMSYGMGVGESVFETVFWTGIFAAHNWKPFSRVPRLDVKMALCHDSKAKKGNVNQALKDYYDTRNPVGTKKNQGPLYDFARNSGDGLTHRWDALALAVTTYLAMRAVSTRSRSVDTGTE